MYIPAEMQILFLYCQPEIVATSGIGYIAGDKTPVVNPTVGTTP